jgi:hypothetical protein
MVRVFVMGGICTFVRRNWGVLWFGILVSGTVAAKFRIWSQASPHRISVSQRSWYRLFCECVGFPLSSLLHRRWNLIFTHSLPTIHHTVGYATTNDATPNTDATTNDATPNTDATPNDATPNSSVNKIRMLQLTRRNTIGRRSTRVPMTYRAFPLWLERQSSFLLSFVRFSFQFSSVICLFVPLAVIFCNYSAT